ncbi:hypothetical protein F2Q68_00011662 [Brassica cretica]|uniref:Uncharacterized protein n=1 Tax=Brassica cretica TaxID=69181 RepID=A0A8S9KS42_BRACR|nr:hypothetical protein F2Q68_00011662 [Brassica cretica]
MAISLHRVETLQSAASRTGHLVSKALDSKTRSLLVALLQRQDRGGRSLVSFSEIVLENDRRKALQRHQL